MTVDPEVIRARKEAAATIIGAQQKGDFDDKYLVFRRDSADVLGGNAAQVFYSEKDAEDAIKEVNEPGVWEVGGPIKFATSGIEGWWIDYDGNPHLDIIKFIGAGAGKKPGVRLVLRDKREETYSGGDSDFMFELLIFKGSVT